MRLTEAPYALVIVICRCSNWPSIEMRSRMLSSSKSTASVVRFASKEHDFVSCRIK
jgi:hypothetical protein